MKTEKIKSIKVKIEDFVENCRKDHLDRLLSKEEPKQETLEEAAENYTEFWLQNKGLLIRDAFAAGAKWQQEQDKNKYSEEEVGEILYKAFGEYGKHYSLMLDGTFIDRLFKQFKKK